MTLRILSVGFATIQDRGWPAGRAFGLPQSGALDREALAVGNQLVGNPPNAAAIEFTAGNLEVDFEDDAVVALTGGPATVAIDDAPHRENTSCVIRRGQRLVAVPSGATRFRYLAVSGGIATPPVLGSRSTYVPIRLGGFQGRPLRRGDRLPIGSPSGSIPSSRTAAPDSRPDPGVVRLVPNGHTEAIDPSAWETLVAGPYRVTPASDRMGTRLAGEPLRLAGEASGPSEGMTVGAIQVPPNGQPIVVLADGPTVGGYPRIGTIIGADLGRFAQLPLGSSVGFRWVSVREAQRLLRESADRLAGALHRIARGGR